GAFLRKGFAPGDEIAFRIAAATIEGLSPLGTALHYFALRAVRARNSNGFLLGVFALRIIAAGDEFAKPSVLLRQIAAALRAFLVERHIRFFLPPSNAFGGFAVRIAGTGVERTEAALLE